MNSSVKTYNHGSVAVGGVRAYEETAISPRPSQSAPSDTLYVRSQPSSRPRRTHWPKRSSYQRERCHERLKPKQVANLFEADDYAARIRLRLNLFLTIRWPIDAATPQRLNVARKRMREWLEHRSVEFAWIFVHENPPDACFNTHMLVHVPSKLQANFMAAAASFFNLDTSDDAFDIKRRYGLREKAIRYMCKGTDWATAVRHGIHDGRPESRWKAKQGSIPFKRAGWSQNIGAAARKKSSTL